MLACKIFDEAPDTLQKKLSEWLKRNKIGDESIVMMTQSPAGSSNYKIALTIVYKKPTTEG